MALIVIMSFLVTKNEGILIFLVLIRICVLLVSSFQLFVMLKNRIMGKNDLKEKTQFLLNLVIGILLAIFLVIVKKDDQETGIKATLVFVLMLMEIIGVLLFIYWNKFVREKLIF
jgi:undecaprenyl pyrophosphate phosphatase UppP